MPMDIDVLIGETDMFYHDEYGCHYSCAEIPAELDDLFRREELHEYLRPYLFPIVDAEKNGLLPCPYCFTNVMLE